MDADCWICSPVAEVHESVYVSIPVGVAPPVGIIFEPSFASPMSVAPCRTLHCELALMPTEVHDTRIGFPRLTTFGCTIISAACGIIVGPDGLAFDDWFNTGSKSDAVYVLV